MIGVDALLLFVLVVQLLNRFTDRASVYFFASTERFLVFSVMAFLALGLYLGVSLLRGRDRRVVERTIIIGVLAFFLIGSLAAIQFIARQRTLPYLYVHDGAVQTEAAIGALQEGRNPYDYDYRSTPFGAFPDGFSGATRPNPAWDHYIYLPLPVLLGLPLKAFTQGAFDWFDIRLLYLMGFVVLVVATALLARAPERRLVALILILFNPIFLQFVLSGFNDVFWLAAVALAAVALQRKRWWLASVAVGAALASKQSAWFLLPFLVAHATFAVPAVRRWAAVGRRLWPAAAVAGLVIAPFLLWSPANFFDDTVRYGTGSATYSYPISGQGLGELLLSAGIVRSMWDNFPFWVPQLLVGVPLAVWLITWQRRHPTVSRLLAAYGLFTLAVLFVSRFFNDSYIGVVSVIFILAYAAHEEPKGHEET